jgi:hypothetical protein
MLHIVSSRAFFFQIDPKQEIGQCLTRGERKIFDLPANGCWYFPNSHFVHSKAGGSTWLQSRAEDAIALAHEIAHCARDASPPPHRQSPRAARSARTKQNPRAPKRRGRLFGCWLSGSCLARPENEIQVCEQL